MAVTPSTKRKRVHDDDNDVPDSTSLVLSTKRQRVMQPLENGTGTINCFSIYLRALTGAGRRSPTWPQVPRLALRPATPPTPKASTNRWPKEPRKLWAEWRPSGAPAPSKKQKASESRAYPLADSQVVAAITSPRVYSIQWREKTNARDIRPLDEKEYPPLAPRREIQTGFVIEEIESLGTGENEDVAMTDAPAREDPPEDASDNSHALVSFGHSSQLPDIPQEFLEEHYRALEDAPDVASRYQDLYATSQDAFEVGSEQFPISINESPTENYPDVAFNNAENNPFEDVNQHSVDVHTEQFLASLNEDPAEHRRYWEELELAIKQCSLKTNNRDPFEDLESDGSLDIEDDLFAPHNDSPKFPPEDLNYAAEVLTHATVLCLHNPRPSPEVQAELCHTLRQLPWLLTKEGHDAEPQLSLEYGQALDGHSEAVYWGRIESFWNLQNTLEVMELFEHRADAIPVATRGAPFVVL